MTASFVADWSGVRGLLALVNALDPESRGLTRLVGGCVRDRLLGLPVSDFDLATALTPEVVLERLRQADLKAIPTGLAHGTITALVEGQPFEVTTLRRDESTDGRHATVAFTDSWAEDAMRRDFTINALYSDPRTGAIYDPVGGLKDLSPIRVRFIGDADARIQEDYLRILRYFRFFARFGERAPDDIALKACARHMRGLMALSRERVAQELLKTLAAPDPSFALTAMESISLFSAFLPTYQFGSGHRMADLVEHERRFDVAPNALRRMSLILPTAEPMLKSVIVQLKLSKIMGSYLIAVAALRRRLESHEPISMHQMLYDYGVSEAMDALLIARGGLIANADWAAMQAWIRPEFPIKGRDLIALGLPPGPLVSRCLRTIETAWVRSGFPDGEKFSRIVSSVVKDGLE